MSGTRKSNTAGGAQRPARMYAKKRKLTPGKEKQAVNDAAEQKPGFDPTKVPTGEVFTANGGTRYKWVATKTGRLLVVCKPGA